MSSSECMGAAMSAPSALGDPIVVVDSREQQPYSFPNSVVRGLPLADYSVQGYETRIGIERKRRGWFFIR